MKFASQLFALLVAGLLIGAPAGLRAEKQTAPEPEPIKKLSFPPFNEFTLKNGLDVVVVEHHEQPVASLWLAIRSGNTLDGEAKSSLASLTGTLLNKGTDKYNSDQIAEWIESKGGTFDANVGDDATIFTVSILSEYLDVAYEFLSHIMINATFPEDELDRERKREKTALEFQLSDPNSMADRHFMSVVYGPHPYAVQPTPESVEAVTREDVTGFHKRNYVANNAVMFVVGDVKTSATKKRMEKYFGAWKRGTPDQVSYPAPPERTAKNIALYHRPGSVQTNLYVGHTGMRPTDPDWAKVTVANRILGGGATGRLFMTLREERGWTYGAYSNFSKRADMGYFRATANVRTEVTDSALTEMLALVNDIVDKPVTDKEISDAKSYLIGNFPTTIETPNQIARQIGQIKLLGLDKKYLETYREEIAKVTIADVETAMKDHVHPDRFAVIAVGDAVEIYDKVAPIAPVALYDIEGVPLSPDQLSVQATDFAYDPSALRDMQATYSVKVNDQMEIGDMSVSLAKNKTSGHFDATSKIVGMIKMEESQSFGGGNFAPHSYDFSMNAMGNEVLAEYEFTSTNASGTVTTAGKEPKAVDVKLVNGTILINTVEFVVATLPLDKVKKYQFPALDTQSGTLQNISISVDGEEDIMVPAGSFSIYKVRVKTGEGEQVLFVRKAAPHVLIKQEIPAQRLSIILKDLKMM